MVDFPVAHPAAQHSAPAYLAALAPPGSHIFATGEARLVVELYRAMQRGPRIPIDGGLHWWSQPDRFEPELASFRRRHSLTPNDPIYFVEGGFVPFDFPRPLPSGPLRKFGTPRVWLLPPISAASPPSPPLR